MSALPGRDVAQDDAGQVREEPQAEFAVTGLRDDQQPGSGPAGPGHGGDRGGRVTGQGQRDEHERLAGQVPVPDPAERLGPAGAGRLQPGQGRQQGHAAPPARSSRRVLACRGAGDVGLIGGGLAAACRQRQRGLDAVQAAEVLTYGRSQHVQEPAARASSRQKPAISQVRRQRGWSWCTCSRAGSSDPASGGSSATAPSGVTSASQARSARRSSARSSLTRVLSPCRERGADGAAQLGDAGFQVCVPKAKEGLSAAQAKELLARVRPASCGKAAAGSPQS